MGLVHHIYFDRRLLPDLGPFIRFAIDATGRIHDARGEVLVEVARENRRVVSYNEVPPVAEPHIIDRVTDVAGGVLYQAPRTALEIGSTGLDLIQEGLRGVVRLPEGTALALAGRDFPIPVMGKTGTTSEFRNALFVGSKETDVLDQRSPVETKDAN